MIIQLHNSYRIGSHSGLSKDQMNEIAGRVSEPRQDTHCFSPGELAGRNHPCIFNLDGYGRVISKQYFRGGVIRHLNKRTYLAAGPNRGQAEFEMLEKVRTVGVDAPEPIAFVTKGRLFYNAWLIMRILPDTRSLAAISRAEPERAESIVPEAAAQIRTLIANGILHVDMHPGNILVDPMERTYLIDFDKARTGIKSVSYMTDKYLARWRRAVEKYGLPEFLAAMMENELTQK